MEEEIKKLPKVELHLHLDGSVRVETASEIKKIEVASKMQVTSDCTNLNDYLTKFEIPISIMQTKENLERISCELATDLKDDNVIYAEIRFAPIFHTKEGLTLEEVVEAVLKGLKKVSIKTNLILCMMRGMSYEENEKIIFLAQKYINRGVGGIDLAGAEALYKTRDYKSLFELANKLSIPFTIHAGEADGIESIESALSFGTKRLGHGIRSLENKQTIQKLINDNIILEVCPKSNIDTHLVKNYLQHPLKKLYDLGVKVTINTDNKTVSNINLSSEYINLMKNLNFTKEEFLICNLNAVEASFLDNNEKEKLQNVLKIAYSK